MAKRLLLVEDDPNLGFIIKDNLEERGYEVVHCDNGHTAESIIHTGSFDLFIFDVMLPQKDGFTLAEDAREKGIETPIIFMTARDMLEDKMRGFNAGADDYITKPFELEELYLRIEAVLKRKGVQESNTPPLSNEYMIGKYKLIAPELKLEDEHGEFRTLTKKEASLLEYLVRYANRPIKREEILRAIWNDDSYFAGRSMDVYITKLRKYLKDDPNIEIQNVHGVGFKLNIL